jgi:hypothetical protein
MSEQFHMLSKEALAEIERRAMSDDLVNAVKAEHQDDLEVAVVVCMANAAYALGVERGKALRTSEWVRVDDALPDEDIDVLLSWGPNFPYDIGSWTGVYFQRSNDDMSEYDADPQHWQPLPAAPKKESA